MNWNAQPESAALPPPYSKTQSSILQQFLIHQPSISTQRAVNYPPDNPEACMYSSNSNSVSQTKVERVTYGNVKGPQQPIHNLLISSGIIQNVKGPQQPTHSLQISSGIIQNVNVPQQPTHNLQISSGIIQNVNVPQQPTHNLRISSGIIQNVKGPQQPTHSLQISSGIIQNVKGPQQPTHNLQISSGIIQNVNVPQQPTHNLQISSGMIQNVKGPQQPTHNLQMSSGMIQNVWLNSPVRSSVSSHTEAVVSHQMDFGANTPYMRGPQNQLVTSDTHSVQLQMIPSSSLKGPVACQGNLGLTHSVPDQLVDWAQQYTSNELMYPDFRAPPKQYSYLPQSFVQDATVQKQNVTPSPSLQAKNNQLSTSAQTFQSKHLAPVSYQHAMETNKRPPPPYHYRHGSQPAIKPLSPEAPQSSELHSSEQRKQLYEAFEQWKNASENRGTSGNFCEFNVKQPHSEPVGSSVSDGVQMPAQNNPEKKMYPCDANENLVLDATITKEKLVRDIKSLVEIKKKFSELARKIKINKDLLLAAGCSKTANSAYGEGEPAPACDFSKGVPDFSKGVPAKSDGHCSMELLATCLSLWKNQPPKTTDEKEGSRGSGAAPAAGAGSRPADPKSLCSAGGSPQKMLTPSQALLSVVTQGYDSSAVGAAKGSELQIAVVSPLILPSVKALPGRGVGPAASPGPLYPVVKAGSVCSLQSQLAEGAAVAAALSFAAKVPAAGGPASAEVASLPGRREEEHEPVQGRALDATRASLRAPPPLAEQPALPEPSDGADELGHTLRIESICSLAEGDVSYNSQIAEIFNSFPLKPHQPREPLSPGELPVGGRQRDPGGPALREDKSVQCSGVPSEGAEEPSTVGHMEANGEVVEDSGLELTTKTESPAKPVRCSPRAPLQDAGPPEAEAHPGDLAQDPPADGLQEEKEPVLYLHDQLSELLKEFPYGIEGVSGRKGGAGQPRADQSSEDQTGGKAGCVSEDNTDQIQITVLSSEQIKELFPEEDGQPCDADRVAEPEKEKAVTEAGSLRDPQAPRGGESCDPVTVDSEKDKIHCCALGWLSQVYEGVPQCQCSASKRAAPPGEGEKGQCCPPPPETSSCKRAYGDVAVELNSVTNNLKPPLTSAGKGHPETTRGKKFKKSKKKQSNSSLRTELEGTSQRPRKCESRDPKNPSEKNQGCSLKAGQKPASQCPSKSDKPDPLNSHSRKKALKFHEVHFSSCNNKPAVSKPVSQDNADQKKCPPQNPGLPKAQKHLVPRKELGGKSGSPVLPASPEKKKLKFRAGGSKVRFFEKRKTDHGIIPDLEIKKKKYEKQDLHKREEGMVNLGRAQANPNERPSVKEKTAPSPESSDPKGRPSRTTKVITLSEYLQRQKNRDVMANNASKNCVGNVPSAPEHASSKLLAPMSWEKAIKRDSSSAEESVAGSVPRTVQGKVAGQQPDQAGADETRPEKRPAGVGDEAEAGQPPAQAKEQGKLYLNRVAFKCTERESICLTKLDSASQKGRKDRSREGTPKTDAMGKPSLLEFKLCPDTLLKTASSVDKQGSPPPGKDAAPLQVSGIKSTKEDWLKCGPTRTKMPEASQQIDNANSRVPKRSLSADGFETLQPPVKDSSTMFQTYKQMYLDKRSRSQSLESSSVK